MDSNIASYLLKQLLRVAEVAPYPAARVHRGDQGQHALGLVLLPVHQVGTVAGWGEDVCSV